MTRLWISLCQPFVTSDVRKCIAISFAKIVMQVLADSHVEEDVPGRDARIWQIINCQITKLVKTLMSKILKVNVSTNWPKTTARALTIDNVIFQLALYFG